MLEINFEVCKFDVLVVAIGRNLFKTKNTQLHEKITSKSFFKAIIRIVKCS